MKFKYWSAAALAAALLVPAIAFADDTFAQKSQRAQQQVAQLSQQQLDNLSINPKVFSDAYMAARIVGYDRNDIDQLKADVAELKTENAQLRAALGTQTVGTAPAASVSTTDLANLNARVTKLEGMFAGLQDSLVMLINMVSEVLAKH